MGFRDYYRQFEAMAPEEISQELLALRDERRRQALSRIEPLDLSGTDWHEPPHPDAVNAATFALRRAVNAYPDRRGRAAARRGRRAARPRLRAGHDRARRGRAAARALRPAARARRRRARRLARLAAAARAGRGRRRPGGAGPGRAGGDRRAGRRRDAGGPADEPVRPDRRGALAARLRDVCTGVPEGVTVVVDEALGEFAADGEDAAPLVAELPNLVVVRSFSKAHAMAGLRAGAALGPPELVGRLAPSGGIGAPAQAAALWAASDGGAELAARRRAVSAALHERLAGALAGSPVSAAPGAVPFAWLSSSAEDGAALGQRLAAARVFVAPGRLWGDERHVRASLRGAAAVDRLAAALVG